MSETTALAQTIVGLVRDAVAGLPKQLAVGKVADVRVNPQTGRVTGVSVDLKSGRTECEWSGGFEAEVAQYPQDIEGRDCEVALIDGRAIVHGVIWTGA